MFASTGMLSPTMRKRQRERINSEAETPSCFSNDRRDNRWPIVTIQRYSIIQCISIYQTLNKTWIALYGVLSCFFAVSTIEWSSRKASAPKSERNVHEFFSLIFSLRIPRSLPLLSEGIIGFSRKLKMKSLHLTKPFLNVMNFLPSPSIFCLSRLSKRWVHDTLSITSFGLVFRSWMASRNRLVTFPDHSCSVFNSERYCSSRSKWARHTWWLRKWSAKYALWRSVTAVIRSKLSPNLSANTFEPLPSARKSKTTHAHHVPFILLASCHMAYAGFSFFWQPHPSYAPCLAECCCY